ncbi:MAG: hypothetical protein WCQ66_10315 [Sphaerochaetaceae bacterium]
MFLTTVMYVALESVRNLPHTTFRARIISQGIQGDSLEQMGIQLSRTPLHKK